MRKVLVLLILLPGCRFFTDSLFPGYLAQVEKSYDLESEISTFLASVGASDYALRPSVFVLTASTGEDYGGLLVELDSIPVKLLLMAGPSGAVQQLTSSLLSQLHFTNSSGYFVVGRHFFPFGDLSLAGDSELANIDGRGFSISSSASNYRLWSDGSNLFHQTLNIGSVPWSGGTSISLSIEGGVTGFELRELYFDPLAANPLALVFFNGSMNRVYVFRVPAPGYISQPLASSYPPVSFGDTDASRVIYTRKGIVVIEDRTATLMDVNGSPTNKHLNLGEGGDKQLAFDIEGDVFYVFDPENKTLFRGRSGW